MRGHAASESATTVTVGSAVVGLTNLGDDRAEIMLGENVTASQQLDRSDFGKVEFSVVRLQGMP